MAANPELYLTTKEYLKWEKFQHGKHEFFSVQLA
jgi:hypothetical protein